MKLRSTIAVIVLLPVVVSVAVWVACTRYAECRAHGFSKFYCLTQK